MITLEDVSRARSEIAPHVKRTPLERSATLSRELGTNVPSSRGEPSTRSCS